MRFLKVFDRKQERRTAAQRHDSVAKRKALNSRDDCVPVFDASVRTGCSRTTIERMVAESVILTRPAYGRKSARGGTCARLVSVSAIIREMKRREKR